MNTEKIAALYASPIFNTLLRFPNFDTTTTLTAQVREHVMHEARVVSEDGRRYKIVALHPGRRERHTDDFGRKTPLLLEELTTKRVGDWLLNQMPGWPETERAHLRKDAADEDVLVVDVVGYGKRDDENPENDVENRGGMRWGTQEELGTILRGMYSIRRKRRKQAKKLEAQLRSYHQEQLGLALAKQQEKLREGQWLGAEKAITTAARVDEPGVPFLGDTGLTYEQRKEMGLRYWAVSAHTHGMSAAFPAGTGVALKPVKRSRELVDGAVYLWMWLVNGNVEMSVMGHLDLSAKQRGYLPLRMADNGKVPDYCWAAWDKEDVKIYRVTHYTTRNAEPVAEVAATPLHQPQLRGQRRERRELAQAA